MYDIISPCVKMFYYLVPLSALILNNIMLMLYCCCYCCFTGCCCHCCLLLPWLFNIFCKLLIWLRNLSTSVFCFSDGLISIPSNNNRGNDVDSFCCRVIYHAKKKFTLFSSTPQLLCSTQYSSFTIKHVVACLQSVFLAGI